METVQPISPNRNKLALISLILPIVSIFIAVFLRLNSQGSIKSFLYIYVPPLVISLLCFVFGIAALIQIKRHQERGRAIAWIAIVFNFVITFYMWGTYSGAYKLIWFSLFG